MSNYSPSNRTQGGTSSLNSGFLLPGQLTANTSNLSLQPSGLIGHKSYLPTVSHDEGPNAITTTVTDLSIHPSDPLTTPQSTTQITSQPIISTMTASNTTTPSQLTHPQHHPASLLQSLPLSKHPSGQDSGMVGLVGGPLMVGGNRHLAVGGSLLTSPATSTTATVNAALLSNSTASSSHNSSPTSLSNQLNVGGNTILANGAHNNVISTISSATSSNNASSHQSIPMAHLMVGGKSKPLPLASMVVNGTSPQGQLGNNSQYNPSKGPGLGNNFPSSLNSGNYSFPQLGSTNTTATVSPSNPSGSTTAAIAMARPPMPTIPWSNPGSLLKSSSPNSTSPPNGRGDTGLIPQHLNMNPSLAQPSLATLAANLVPPHLNSHTTTQAQHALHENMRRSHPVGALNLSQIGLSQPPRARPALLNLMTDAMNYPIELAAAQSLHYSNNPLEPPHLDPTTSLVGPHAQLNGSRGQYEVGQHMKNNGVTPMKRSRPVGSDDGLEFRPAPMNPAAFQQQQQQQQQMGSNSSGSQNIVRLPQSKPVLPPNVAQYVGGSGGYRYPAEPYSNEDKVVRLEEWNVKRKEILTGDEAEHRSAQRKQTAESRPRKGGRFIKKTEAEKLEASKRKKEEQQRLRQQQNQQ